MAREKNTDQRQGLLQRILHSSLAVWQKFNAEGGPLAAAATAFYLTLSMVPLLLLLVSVAAFFISPTQIFAIGRELTTSFGAGIGGALRDQVLSVVQHRGVLTGIALLVGLWTGSQLFVIIESALNAMWGLKERRSFLVTHGLALVMVVAIGILTLIAVLLTYLVRVLGRVNLPLPHGGMHHFPWLVVFLVNFVLPWILISLTFLIMYCVLPAYKVTWKIAWPSALLAGILWTLIVQIFSWYTVHVANYAVLYGSLGWLVLLMLWFNYSAMIMLLGAEVISIRYPPDNVANQTDQR